MATFQIGNETYSLISGYGDPKHPQVMWHKAARVIQPASDAQRVHVKQAPEYASAYEMYLREQAARAAQSAAESADLTARIEAGLRANKLRSRSLWSRIDKTGEAVFIRYGAPPAGGQSYNYRDNHYEAGVSVYRAWQIAPHTYVLDLRTASPAFVSFTAASPCIVSGTLLGTTGSDDEPLLEDVRIVRRLAKNASIHQLLFDRAECGA